MLSSSKSGLNNELDDLSEDLLDLATPTGAKPNEELRGAVATPTLGTGPMTHELDLASFSPYGPPSFMADLQQTPTSTPNETSYEAKKPTVPSTTNVPFNIPPPNSTNAHHSHSFSNSAQSNTNANLSTSSNSNSNFASQQRVNEPQPTLSYNPSFVTAGQLTLTTNEFNTLSEALQNIATPILGTRSLTHELDLASFSPYDPQSFMTDIPQTPVQTPKEASEDQSRLPLLSLPSLAVSTSNIPALAQPTFNPSANTQPQIPNTGKASSKKAIPTFNIDAKALDTLEKSKRMQKDKLFQAFNRRPVIYMTKNRGSNWTQTIEKVTIPHLRDSINCLISIETFDHTNLKGIKFARKLVFKQESGAEFANDIELNAKINEAKKAYLVYILSRRKDYQATSMAKKLPALAQPNSNPSANPQQQSIQIHNSTASEEEITAPRGKKRKGDNSNQKNKAKRPKISSGSESQQIRPVTLSPPNSTNVPHSHSSSTESNTNTSLSNPPNSNSSLTSQQQVGGLGPAQPTYPLAPAEQSTFSENRMQTILSNPNEPPQIEQSIINPYIIAQDQAETDGKSFNGLLKKILLQLQSNQTLAATQLELTRAKQELVQIKGELAQINQEMVGLIRNMIVASGTQENQRNRLSNIERCRMQDSQQTSTSSTTNHTTATESYYTTQNPNLLFLLSATGNKTSTPQQLAQSVPM